MQLRLSPKTSSTLLNPASYATLTRVQPPRCTSTSGIPKLGPVPGASSTSPYSSALAAAMYALQPPMLVLPSVSNAGAGATQSEGAKHPSCDAATAPALMSRNPIVMRADFARETSKPNCQSCLLRQTSHALTRHAALTAENIIQRRTASVRSGATAMTPSGSTQSMLRYVCTELMALTL